MSELWIDHPISISPYSDYEIGLVTSTGEQLAIGKSYDGTSSFELCLLSVDGILGTPPAKSGIIPSTGSGWTDHPEPVRFGSRTITIKCVAMGASDAEIADICARLNNVVEYGRQANSMADPLPKMYIKLPHWDTDLYTVGRVSWALAPDHRTVHGFNEFTITFTTLDARLLTASSVTTLSAIPSSSWTTISSSAPDGPWITRLKWSATPGSWTPTEINFSTATAVFVVIPDIIITDVTVRIDDLTSMGFQEPELVIDSLSKSAWVHEGGTVLDYIPARVPVPIVGVPSWSDITPALYKCEIVSGSGTPPDQGSYQIREARL